MPERKPNRHTASPDTPVSRGEAGDLARGDPTARDEYQGRSGGGDSAGGPYPGPDPDDDQGEAGLMGHGGQSRMAYHGKGRLGDRKVGRNANAPAEPEED